MIIPAYSTFKEKEKYFDTYKIQGKGTLDTKREYDFFHDNIISNKMQKSIFRGVNEASYKLYTSIQRAFIKGNVNTSESISSFIEKEIMCLKRNNILSKYYKALGLPITDFLYLSFLQHHGALTSFLDFSHNPNIALYFATANICEGQGSSQVPDIEDYFSVYWIELNKCGKELTNVLEFYLNGYIDGVELLINQGNEKIDDSNLSDLSKYLSWTNPDNNDEGLNSLSLGFIDSNNHNRHITIGDINVASSQFKTYVKRYVKTRSKTSEQKWKVVLRYFFSEIIKIVNLNLIAQDGCFIHYNPQKMQLEIDKPLEYLIGNKNKYLPKIHCANIHKSLAPYIIQINDISKETIYPNANDIVQTVLNNSYIDLDSR